MYPLVHLHADRRPPQQWAFVGYKQLRGDVEATVMGVLARLGYRRGDAADDDVGRGRVGSSAGAGPADDNDTDDDYEDLRALLRVEAARQQSERTRYVSSHTYTVEETTGMTSAQLRAVFEPVYAAHGDML